MKHLPGSHEPRRERRASARPRLAALLGLLCLATPLAADTVVRRDGSHVEGTVQSVDSRHVVVRTSGDTISIPRADVASIHFSHTEPVRPLKVEIRNVRSDDAVDVLLHDELVVKQGREGGRWVDLTSKLKDGNNPLRLRIHNSRGTWAYQLSLRINGVVTAVSCGKALDRDNPCECCGKTGREVGVIDDLPPIWLYVDRETGSAEVLR